MNKTRLTYILIALCFLGIVGYAVNLVLNPPIPDSIDTTPITSSGFGEITQELNIIDQLPQASFPEFVTLYQADVPSGEEQLEVFAKNLILIPSDYDPLIWQSPSRAKSLAYYEGTNYVQYSFFDPNPIPNNPQFNLSEVEQAAQGFINDVARNNAFQFQLSEAIFFAQDAELIETSSLSDAGFVGFELSYQVDDIPIVINSSSTKENILLLDSNNQVIKANIPLPPNQLQSLNSLELIDYQVALDTLKTRGFVSHIVYQGISQVTYTIDDFSELTITNVKLVYRYNLSSGLLEPYYVFDAKGNAKDGNEVVLELSTPAFK